MTTNDTSTRHLTKAGRPHLTVCGKVAANVPVTALPRKANCPECVPAETPERPSELERLRARVAELEAQLAAGSAK